MSEIKGIINELAQIVNMTDFLEESYLMSFIDETISVLENEDTSYRPKSSDGEAGGLLDFTSYDKKVIIVPDLHCRYMLLYTLMQHKIDGKSVLELMEQNEVIVVCVGDCIHTETLDEGYDRWHKCYAEWEKGHNVSEPMKEEMLDSFKTWLVVMKLKKEFPANFHFLKGNHENILNEEGNGNHAFHKFVMEGEQVRDFVQEFYSDGTLYLIHYFEKSLPIVCAFSSFAISHAEPACFYRRKDIINYKKNPSLILGFTWTRNDEAEDFSVEKTYSELCTLPIEKDRVLWFGGHRPVEGKYLLRQKGRYIQIHNPFSMNVALVNPQKAFNPDTDIISLN